MQFMALNPKPLCRGLFEPCLELLDLLKLILNSGAVAAAIGASPGHLGALLVPRFRV